MNSFGQKLLIVFFISYIFGIGIAFFLKEDREVSTVENRTLAQIPRLTTENILTSNFSKDFETYYTDQFPSRNRWISLYIQYEYLVNKTYINDHYIDSEGWIMGKPLNKTRKSALKDSTDKLNELANYLNSRDVDTYLFFVPHKLTILSDIFPEHLRKDNDKEDLNTFLSMLDNKSIHVENLLHTFTENHSLEELKEFYFRTDHHWNAEGAFYGYREIMSRLSSDDPTIKLNDQDLESSYYQKICFDKSKNVFQGSYNRKLFMIVPTASDQEDMCYYDHDLFSSFDLIINNEKKKFNDYYARGNKALELTYSDIFARDYDQIKILNRSGDGKLLIIKDSYANPLIPHIAQHFSETTVFDVRHNDQGDLYRLIDGNEFSKVIIIYNNTNMAGEIYNF